MDKTSLTSNKPQLSFWQIWNMSFGFLGIQFGFALQGSSMSRIFQTLGAESHEIPLLWIAAPLTGLLVQPIIGYLSDRTWSPKFGRRKPYFLIGAILSSITLIFVPYSPYLWVAAGGLWILDASINISMEPFRALVADKLPKSQRSYGFVVQTLIIGIGTFVASQLPWFLTTLGVSNNAVDGVVPANVKMSFLIGGLIFLGTILYTIFTTTEYPPDDLEEFEEEKRQTAGFGKGIREIFGNIVNMPPTMVKLGVIQFFSWFSFFTMWSLAVPALTEHVFKSAKPMADDFNMSDDAMVAIYDTANLAYNNAADLVSSAMGTYGLSSMVFALILVFITKRMEINRKYVHMASLILGGMGFLLMYYANSQMMLHVSFALIGIAWASILSMPYAMLSSSIDPNKMGIFMGIFNIFIVLPQIIAALGGVNWASKTFFGDANINAMILAGSSLIIAGLCNFLITNPEAIKYSEKVSDSV